MLRQRKPVPSTNVFVFDESGTKVQLSPADFGARAQERMGSHVKSLSPPPPTQFIQVPQHLLSLDQVVLDMVQEKRTLSWRMRVVVIAAQRVVNRCSRVAERWMRRAKIEVLRTVSKLRERARRARIKDSWGFDDFTEVADAPPAFRPRRRRPSVV
jgi:hypothetical protein